MIQVSCSSRYPNISCELLTSDVSQMNDRLGEDESLLMKLYSFLLNDPPLNPLLASFFSKVLSILISRKPEQVNTVSQKVSARADHPPRGSPVSLLHVLSVLEVRLL